MKQYKPLGQGFYYVLSEVGLEEATRHFEHEAIDEPDRDPDEGFPTIVHFHDGYRGYDYLGGVDLLDPSKISAMSEVTPLFQEGPEQHRGSLSGLAEFIQRLKTPWRETTTLTDSRTILADELELPDNHPVINAILENTPHDITTGDLFHSGSMDVVLTRVITIKNGDVLSQLVSYVQHDHAGQLRELTYFDSEDPEPHLLAIGGMLLVSENYPVRNNVLWDGETYRLIIQPEQNRQVPEALVTTSEGTHTVGGFNYSEIIRSTEELLNQLNQGCYTGQIRTEWLVGQPFHLIENTFGFLADLLSDSTAEFIELASLHTELNKE